MRLTNCERKKVRLMVNTHLVQLPRNPRAWPMGQNSLYVLYPIISAHATSIPYARVALTFPCWHGFCLVVRLNPTKTGYRVYAPQTIFGISFFAKRALNESASEALRKVCLRVIRLNFCSLLIILLVQCTKRKLMRKRRFGSCWQDSLKRK